MLKLLFPSLPYTTIEYLTVGDVIIFNKIALEIVDVKRGDRHKVLSIGKIQNALTACMNEPGDIFDKAAVLLIELTKMPHAFDSGNRRTALVSAMAFLELNHASAHVQHEDNAFVGIRQGFIPKTR
jgi:prophage maintenance system killer protein